MKKLIICAALLIPSALLPAKNEQQRFAAIKRECQDEIADGIGKGCLMYSVGSALGYASGVGLATAARLALVFPLLRSVFEKDGLIFNTVAKWITQQNFVPTNQAATEEAAPKKVVIPENAITTEALARANKKALKWTALAGLWSAYVGLQHLHHAPEKYHFAAGLLAMNLLDVFLTWRKDRSKKAREKLGQEMALLQS